MEELIARYGRARIWHVLVSGGLLIGVVLLLVIIAVVRGPAPIAPEDALANKGHIVVVRAICDDGDPVHDASYTVITQAGRPPAQDSGDLAGNMAQVVVGADWIGQVKLQHEYGTETVSEISDLIGEPFGWHERTVEFHDC